MTTSVSRDDIVKKIAGKNEQAQRMGLMFNSQSREAVNPESDFVDMETQTALGIMSAAGNELSADEENLLHLLDGMNWSNNQVGSFLQVMAQGS